VQGVSAGAQPSGAEVHEDLRPLLFSIAYRMVGIVSEAEDIVQEAFLRYHRAEREDVAVKAPKAYLSAVTTRLAIDHLRSARARRETYVGPWLPEPLLEDRAAPDPGERAEMKDTLSLAFLVMLERLTPVERAAFVLREVFEYPYDEIADVIERSEDNARQLVSRARRHVDADRPRFDVSRERQEELTERFMRASLDGDTEGLIELLAADVVAYADSDGKVKAVHKPIEGADKVARLMVAISRPDRGAAGVTIHAVLINGQPGRLVRDEATGAPVGTLSLEIAGDRVRAVRLVVNPDKLAHIGR
jgi:RNA polymerase sigma-70 factor, ECF subfamily